MEFTSANILLNTSDLSAHSKRFGKCSVALKGRTDNHFANVLHFEFSRAISTHEENQQGGPFP